MQERSILSSILAKKELHNLFNMFDKTGYIEKGFSTKPLFEKVGNMFGILVCKNKNDEIVILKAFSGQFQGNWIVPSFVPPLLDVDEFNKIVQFYDPKTKKLSIDIKNEKDLDKIKELKKERKKYSQIALKKILNTYKIPTIDSKILNMEDICEGSILPSGTGDCCAPKLLGYAFTHNLLPISLAEGFYGKATRKKEHKHIYPPCIEKCSYILPKMLSLDIIYCDEYITVVNKSAGLLTIPGRKEELKDCVTSRLKKLFPSSIEMSAAHRLDMDTSGLLVLGRTKEAHRNLSIQFQNREVTKEYQALIRGIIKEKEGIIELPLRLDVNNRPTQIVDFEKGKSAKTVYSRIQVEKYNNENVTRIKLKPFTGRTHQLRVHCAQKLFPIVGDRLYGERKIGEKRMLLHANYLCFTHPITNEKMEFSCNPNF